MVHLDHRAVMVVSARPDSTDSQAQPKYAEAAVQPGCAVEQGQLVDFMIFIIIIVFVLLHVCMYVYFFFFHWAHELELGALISKVSHHGSSQ